MVNRLYTLSRCLLTTSCNPDWYCSFFYYCPSMRASCYLHNISLHFSSRVQPVAAKWLLCGHVFMLSCTYILSNFSRTWSEICCNIAVAKGNFLCFVLYPSFFRMFHNGPWKAGKSTTEMDKIFNKWFVLFIM